jgi:hypothetical protein
MWLSRIRTALIVLLATLLLSCSGEKRAIKKINKAVELTSPEFVHSYLVNTYNIPETPYDSSETLTIIRDSIKLDTIVRIDTLKRTDTIQIKNDRMQIRIIRQNDTVYVKGYCVTDTIIREKVVYITKHADLKNFNKNKFYDNFIPIALIVLVVLLIIIAIVRGIKNYIKNNL